MSRRDDILKFLEKIKEIVNKKNKKDNTNKHHSKAIKEKGINTLKMRKILILLCQENMVLEKQALLRPF